MVRGSDVFALEELRYSFGATMSATEDEIDERKMVMSIWRILD